MRAMEALKEVMTQCDIHPSMLSSKLGIKPNVLSERFKQKNISVVKLNEMLLLLNYKIVIVPRNTCLPEGGIEIE